MRCNIFYGLIILCFCTISCADRAYFAIENNTDKTIILEFNYDSIFIRKRIVDYLMYPNNAPSDVFYDNGDMDIFRNINLDSVFINSVDSIPIYVVLPTDSGVGTNGDESGAFLWNHQMTISEYYNYDQKYVKKIKEEGMVSFFLPPKSFFRKACYECGDCSCGVEFPEVKTLKIAIDEEDYIILTERNFRRIMVKTEVENEDGSYLMSIN